MHLNSARFCFILFLIVGLSLASTSRRPSTERTQTGSCILLANECCLSVLTELLCVRQISYARIEFS